MPRLKSKSARESLLRRVRKQRLKSITILPSLITILNGLCGFAAIVLAGRGEFVQAGYILLLAMIADILDGRVARMSQNTSSFGGQLDSLCDIISFGAAPAYLMLKVLDYKLGFAESESFFEAFFQRFIWLAAAAYVSCAAIRLARFNVENEENESAHMSFLGLPTPAAAGVVVSLVIFHGEILPEIAIHNPQVHIIVENIIIYSLAFIAAGVGILMISRIRYPHVLNQYMKGKKPLAYLMTCMLILGLVIFFRQIALVVGFCGFTGWGFGKWVYYKAARLKDKTVLKESLTVTDEANIAAQDYNT